MLLWKCNSEPSDVKKRCWVNVSELLRDCPGFFFEMRLLEPSGLSFGPSAASSRPITDSMSSMATS